MLAILFNCAEPEAITEALKNIKADLELQKRLDDAGILVGAYANRLTAVDPDWTMANSDAPQPFRGDLDERQYWEDFVQLWIKDLGIQVVGGCCGITPEHISYISSHLKASETSEDG